MTLEHIGIEGLSDIYIISNVKKEFEKAVDEIWKRNPPWKRYHGKMIQDLAVLQCQKEKAIDLECFEKIKDDIYSIRHPETRKNVRVLYTITDNGEVILLTVFLEKNDNDYNIAIKRAEYRLRWLNEG
ncbi:type II toxin-antitoxin system RelE/ParE family toxin [Butyrivibrio sp. XPD2006]|uniref:type II toxin-antitoxin system RelE/ParE family toxin n=1 Tax=Butyrivibrio sp. XPD2006 TaxID=1280668 RepID=UPI0003B41596|nr:type II toxin-antitoxin system RelE/ParE family toxin [Butyrivibrio sp. XPD2006]